MKGVNLERALREERRKVEKRNPDDILEAFRDLLKGDDLLDDEITARIFEKPSGELPMLDLRKLDPDRIFTLEQIRNLCVNYRLRFLDSSLFIGEIPYEAISRIKAIQRDQKEDLSHFKIMAPAPMFKLREKDRDPLLFVPLGDQRFYLIHQWGNDLNPLRKLLVYPFRSFESLFKTIVFFALLISVSIPSEIMMGPYDTTSLHIRVIFFFYLFLAFSGLTAVWGFSRFKNFNNALWKSRFLD
ncbi:MAG: hypothetical protein LPK47_06580 [Bacteroidota bacterium]|nr:hypothetical protein [Bacteroidota bacterium]